MNLNRFLQDSVYSEGEDVDFRPLLADFLKAATRAFDAYADNAGKSFQKDVHPMNAGGRFGSDS